MAPRVYSYTDFRTFIKDRFEFLKAKDKSLTHRAFAKKAGLRTSNLLYRVTKGDRNLSPKALQKFAKGLDLSASESDFFCNLAGLNQAKTAEEKFYFSKLLLKNRGFQKLKPLSQAQERYFTQWYYVALFELASTPFAKKRSLKEISDFFLESVPLEKLERAAQDLKDLQILDRKDGQWKPNDEAVVAPDHFMSPLAAEFHDQLCKLASRAIFETSETERDFSSLIFALSEKSFENVKTLAAQFQDELIEILLAEKNPEKIYALNLQVFPLTKKLE